MQGDSMAEAEQQPDPAGAAEGETVAPLAASVIAWLANPESAPTVGGKPVAVITMGPVR